MTNHDPNLHRQRRPPFFFREFRRVEQLLRPLALPSGASEHLLLSSQRKCLSSPIVMCFFAPAELRQLTMSDALTLSTAGIHNVSEASASLFVLPSAKPFTITQRFFPCIRFGIDVEIMIILSHSPSGSSICWTPATPTTRSLPLGTMCNAHRQKW